MGAGFVALENYENPLTAISKELEAINDLPAPTIIKSGADFVSSFNAGLKDSLQLLNEVDSKKSSFELTDSLLGGDNSNTAFQAAAEAVDEFLAKAAEAKEQQAKIISRGNRRLLDAEFAHGQRVARIQENITATTIEAATAAGAARLKAASKFGAAIAEIDNKANQARTQARAEFNRNMDALDNDRKDAKRDRRRELEDIAQELGDDLEKIDYDTARSREKIQTDFGKKRVGAEKKYQTELKRIEDTFADEFASADPFRRKILEFNRKEQLAALETQKADELAALSTQERAALTAMEAKAQREKEILERESSQAREVAAQRYNDEVADLKRRREALESSLQEAQAQRDEATRIEKEKATIRNQEELTKIDEQQAAKVERANKALETENKNYADRLATITRSNAQELTAIKTKLAAVEQAEQQSQAERLSRTKAFSAEMQRYNAMADYYGNQSSSRNTASDSSPAFAGGGGQSGASNAITVINNGVSGGYALAQHTGRTVWNAIRGFA